MPGTDTDEELQTAFEQHGRELRVLCYRMTGSATDAEDLTQETFLKAWRARHAFRREASVRTWLYRIASRTCLDFLALHERRTTPTWSLSEVLERDPRIDPFPDRFPTAGVAVPDPAVVVEARETTDLLLVAALLHLPPRQRIAVVARDVLELSASETAALLDSSVASANSLVQRARAQIRRRRPCAPVVGAADPAEGDVLRRYVAAHHDGDLAALLAVLADDVRVSMPPEEPCRRRAEATELFTAVVGPGRPGDWRLVPVRANGRPAVAAYLRRPGDTVHRAASIDVLEVAHGRLAAVHCFLGDRAFPAFGLPPERP